MILAMEMSFDGTMLLQILEMHSPTFVRNAFPVPDLRLIHFGASLSLVQLSSTMHKLQDLWKFPKSFTLCILKVSLCDGRKGLPRNR